MASYAPKDKFAGRRGYYVSTFSTQSKKLRAAIEAQQLGLFDTGCFDWAVFDEATAKA